MSKMQAVDATGREVVKVLQDNMQAYINGDPLKIKPDAADALINAIVEDA